MNFEMDRVFLRQIHDSIKHNLGDFKVLLRVLFLEDIVFQIGINNELKGL